VHHRSKERRITVRRFGWFDLSQEEAQMVADRRADDALERLLAGDKLLPREPKVSYNGAKGVPIREEIVAEKGSRVVTRNKRRY
jgi:hypothetical protein